MKYYFLDGSTYNTEVKLQSLPVKIKGQHLWGVQFFCHLLVKRLNIIQNDPRMVYTFENDKSCTQLHTSIA